MKTMNEWRTQQELDPTVRWLPRWSVEEAQTLRFLAEPMVVK